MESAEIVRRFLTYFSTRGHTVVPSASLIADDPTLLLVNAGMVPFKPYFLGQLAPPFRRATSAQKCVRTPDIDEVGKTTRHATFFQMLGNFSFGDYFKEQAIPFAWELLTSSEADGGFGFQESRLWVTVYNDDDEAAKLWHDHVGVPEDRIQRRGLADNYWHMGVPGPGGPCSEIYYDRGPEYGREGGPVADEDRYLGSGTWCSCRTSSARSGPRWTSTPRAGCRPATSTRAWAWSGWPRCCRAWTTSTRSTPCGRCSTAPPS
jgi:alanyl-tRNA synthetase